ncbi:unnamed protein product [Chrysoparadoxa australica]
MIWAYLFLLTGYVWETQAFGGSPVSLRWDQHYRRSSQLCMSSREEEIQNKIASLRQARGQGEGYEKVIGKGEDLQKRVEALDEFKDSDRKESQANIRSNVVRAGNSTNMESELETGRRTIVRDEDDPAFEDLAGVDLVGNLMEIADAQALAEEQGGQMSQEGFGSLMQESEAFFNRPSPFARFDNSSSSASSSQEGGPEEVEMVTGSVGGAWSPDQAASSNTTHKPTVGSWGVFERPADISKAYGGGRDPRRLKFDPDAAKAKADATAALLNSYRKGGLDPLLEQESENEEALKVAMAKATKAMRFGDTYGAVDVLEAVLDIASPNGPIGANVWLELGMALEGTGQSYRAQDIYKKLGRSANDEVRKNARGLKLGLEAMDALKYSRMDGENEMGKIWEVSAEQMAIKTDKRYDVLYYAKDKDGKGVGSQVFSIKDAKALLLGAARRGGGVAKSRVQQALRFLRQRSDEATAVMFRQKAGQDEGEQAGDDGVASLNSLVGDINRLEEQLEGTWSLATRSTTERVDYFKRGSGEVTFKKGGVVESKEPAGLLVKDREGRWELSRNVRRIMCTYSSTKVLFVDTGACEEAVSGSIVLQLVDTLTSQSQFTKSQN